MADDLESVSSVCISEIDEEYSATASPSPSRSLSPSRSELAVGNSLLRSPVWEHFKYDSSKDKSVCCISTGNSSSCGTKLKGKFPTNLKQHLKNKHPREIREVIDKDLKKKKEKGDKHPPKVKQATLHQVLKQRYISDSQNYKIITRKLAIFLGSSNVANSLVVSPEFQSLLNSLNLRYQVPGRSVIDKEINMVFMELKAILEVLLQQSSKISLCADIWTKKGFSSVYLGITAHFFTHCITLAVR